VEDEGIYVQYEWGYDMCGAGEREERNIKEITMQCYTATLPPLPFTKSWTICADVVGGTLPEFHP